jgi:hypothetical protein
MFNKKDVKEEQAQVTEEPAEEEPSSSEEKQSSEPEPQTERAPEEASEVKEEDKQEDTEKEEKKYSSEDMSKTVQDRLEKEKVKHQQEIQQLKEQYEGKRPFSPEQMKQAQEEFYAKHDLSPVQQQGIQMIVGGIVRSQVNTLQKMEAMRQLESLRNHPHFNTKIGDNLSFGEQLQDVIGQIKDFIPYVDRKTNTLRPDWVNAMYKQLLADNLDGLIQQGIQQSQSSNQQQKRIVSTANSSKSSVKGKGFKTEKMELTESERKYYDQLTDPNSQTVMDKEEAYEVIKRSRKPKKEA